MEVWGRYAVGFAFGALFSAVIGAAIWIRLLMRTNMEQMKIQKQTLELSAEQLDADRNAIRRAMKLEDCPEGSPPEYCEGCSTGFSPAKSECRECVKAQPDVPDVPTAGEAKANAETEPTCSGACSKCEIVPCIDAAKRDDKQD